MGKRGFILTVIIGLFVLIGVVTYTAIGQTENSKNENSLLRQWDEYMDRAGYTSIEVHQDNEQFVFSFFINESRDELGVLEYSTENVNVETAKIKEDSKINHVFLDGKYRNYLGVRFHEGTNVLGKLGVETVQGNERKYDLYNSEDGSTRSSILLDTSLSKEEIRKLILYSKSGDVLATKEIKD
ncbi:hypothetical protein [Thalassobacillus pellis]|uniref:hypothetical protein n=1 Tax=Thalassobacillus pellis TaxID=748008 RepID=UPI00195FC49A|nr:hypothetical protein [Thalassobacillus pellis]MBM7554499.1 hypothetical protein [Thalassobacillus pellis]